MKKLILILTFITGIVIHIYLMGLNEVLKIPDSFAYLQMASYLKDFSVEGFGTGWFGFFYSLPITIIDFAVNNDFLSAKITNIILLGISAILLFKIGKLYLTRSYNLLLLGLFFLSPTLLHYNINILSENIYLPLFLGLFLLLHKFITDPNYIKIIGISLLLALMYLTRGEAFIYLGSIILIFLYLTAKKDISFPKLLSFSALLILSFFIFISPYIYLLHTKTGEWGLTNKGASNLRQAQLRGQEKMDDAGFEQAVAELTPDKHHLIGGFAGGLKYDKPSFELSLKEYISENPKEFLERFLINQKKLYTKILPRLIIGETLKTYASEHFSLNGNIFYFFYILIPLILFLFGVYRLLFSKVSRYSDEKNLFVISLSFFLIASFFFTLFFVLERYFIILLPIALIVICYGAQGISSRREEKIGAIIYVLIAFLLISNFTLGLTHYHTSHISDDKKYEMKRIAGEWMKENITCYKNTCNLKGEDTQKSITALYKKKQKDNIRIMERFPIVTYYSGTRERWITPYTDKLEDIIEYAKYNKLHFLIVDTMDFKKYRPGLVFLLDGKKKHPGLSLIKKFEEPGKKVFIYKVEY